MARVTYVAKAQQRYEMVPVIGPDGQPKRTLTKRKAKGDRLVYRDVTVADKSKPLPNHKCDRCGAEIAVGQPYKWIAPKSGPYGGTKMYRCGPCPVWHVWEYNYSLGSQLARIAHEGQQAADTSDVSSVADALRSAAEEVRGLAEEKRASAESIESGFGHETAQSQELSETADSLESWADEIEAKADEIESEHDEDLPEKVTCEECDGTGHPDEDDEEAECGACAGDGEVDNPELDDRASAMDDALSILDEAPV